MKRFVCSVLLHELIDARNAKEATREFGKRWQVSPNKVTVETKEGFEKELKEADAGTKRSWRNYVHRWRKYMQDTRGIRTAIARKRASSTQNPPPEESQK